MLSDIEIAQGAKMEHIRDIAASLGIKEDELEYYGKYKAKMSNELWKRVKDNADSKLVLVTAINPTPAARARRLSSSSITCRSCPPRMTPCRSARP